MNASAPIPSAATVDFSDCGRSASATSSIAIGSGSLAVGVPGRVPLDRLAVILRESAPGDETHHAGLIEEEDRGALGPERAVDRLERGIVDGLDMLGAMQPVGQLVERRQLLHAPGERLARPAGAR